MAESPLDSRKNMAFHLYEGGFLVSISADGDEVLDRWHAVLGLLELGGNPEGGATNKLIVLYVYNAAGDVSIDDVESKIKRFGSQAEGKVNLDKKVYQTRSHVPLDLWLLVHR